MIPRNQVIAQIAYQQVAALKENEFKESGKELNKNYASIAHKLPAMILQNGLSQASGFLLAKASQENAHEKMLKHLLNAFQQIDNDFRQVKEVEDFHAKVINSNLTQIMRYTREALEISGWIRRYVQGVLKRDATGEKKENPGEGVKS